MGNQLALDFLNTRPILIDEPVELLPDFSALLRWFQAAGLISSREAAALHQPGRESKEAQGVLEALRGFRERMRKQVISWEHGGAVQRAIVDEINRLMAEHPMRARMEIRADQSSMEPYFEPRQPEDLFAPLAHSAAMLFTNLDRARIRKCNHCVLHFHDTSKKGTRRWCSMQLCGNRLKVAAYAARQRVAAQS